MTVKLPVSDIATTLLDSSRAQTLDVRSSDGARIVGHSWGDPAKPAIVFIHGYNQCELCWAKQIDSSLAERFYLISYDLRGHGASDKPEERERYQNAQLWSDDLAAILDASGVRAAIFVAWSMGSRVALDYMRFYGLEKVAGLNLVGVGGIQRPDLKSTGAVHLFDDMCSEDMSANIRATHEFVRKCFERQPSDNELAEILAYNMVIPAHVRKMIIGVPNQSEEFIRALDIPAMVSFGDADVLNNIRNGEVTAELLPQGRFSLYEGCGHSIFYEDAGRFNHELTEFAEAAWRWKFPS